jgi:hypothetical protein
MPERLPAKSLKNRGFFAFAGQVEGLVRLIASAGSSPVSGIRTV